jgi:hypothetical protein
VLEQEDIEDLNPAFVCREIRQLAFPTCRAHKRHKWDHLRPAQIMSMYVLFLRTTIHYVILIISLHSLTVLSLILGLGIQAAIRPSRLAFSSSEVNKEAALADVTTTSVASFKEYALAVFQPPQSPSEIKETVTDLQPRTREWFPKHTGKNKGAADSQPRTVEYEWLPTVQEKAEDKTKLKPTAKSRASTDIAIRPEAMTPSTKAPPMPTATSVVKAPLTKETKSLDIRLPDSLMEVLNISLELQALASKAVHGEYNDLSEALEELGDAVSRQTEAISKQSLALVEGIKDEFTKRHSRAQQKARQFQEQGLTIVSKLSSHFTERHKIAKDRAKKMRDDWEGTGLEVWQDVHDALSNMVSFNIDKFRDHAAAKVQVNQKKWKARRESRAKKNEAKKKIRNAKREGRERRKVAWGF